MATRPVLSSHEKKMLRRREQGERKLSFNQGSRILDRRDRIEDGFDDESLSDCNFVARGCVTEPFDLSGDPDLEDNLDDLDDAVVVLVVLRVDPYEEMAERFGVDDDVADDQMLCDVVATSPWEEIANDSQAIEVQVFKNLTNEDIAVEKSFIKLVNEQMPHRIVTGDSHKCPLRRGAKSWKHTTTQAAQYLRHTWRGVHQIDTVRGAAPVTVVDDIELTPLGEIEALLRHISMFDDKSDKDRLLRRDNIHLVLEANPPAWDEYVATKGSRPIRLVYKDTGSPAFY